jgi:hypothetical protein
VVGAERILEVTKRSLKKMANMAILRCKVGDGAVAKRILRGMAVLRRTVFEGWTVYGF